YGGEAPAVTSTEAPQTATQSTPVSKGGPQPTDINALIAEAGKDFADYQRLTAEGKLGEAGKKLDELKVVLDKLNAQRKSSGCDCLLHRTRPRYQEATVPARFRPRR